MEETEKIKNLKELEVYYKVAYNWYYCEMYTEEEYNSLIGDWGSYTPEEIVNEMCEIIKTL